jgi:DNA-binding NtrC family response regulator
VDVMMPGIDGIATLEELKKIDEDLAGVMVTAFASVETAISAMKRGAFDYITKPFKNDEVIVVVATPWSGGSSWPRTPPCARACTRRRRSSPASSAAARACVRCST